MAVERFFIKRGSWGSAFPAAAGAPLGGFLGARLARIVHLSPEVGALIGSIGGGTAGKVLGEQMRSSEIPFSAPYAIDPTSAEIPEWATTGAHLLAPALKQGSVTDWVPGEVPGATVVQRGVSGGLPQAGRAFAGLSLGGVGGALGGLALGKGIDRLAGHEVHVPLLNLKLHELLAGVAGSVGATKGLQHLSPEK